MNAGIHGHEGNSHASNSSTLARQHTEREYRSSWTLRESNKESTHHNTRSCVQHTESKRAFCSILPWTKQRARAATMTLEWYSSERIFLFFLSFSVFSSLFSSTVTQTPTHTHTHRHICAWAKWCRELAILRKEYGRKMYTANERANPNYSGIHFICMRHFHGSFQPV